MTDPLDPIEERLRDALRARADAVEPAGVAPTIAGPATDDDAAAARRRRVYMGLAMAAAILVGVGVAAALTNEPGERDRVVSRNDRSTTTAQTTTEGPGTSTTVVTTSSTVAPTTTSTTAPPTTITEPPTTTVPPTTTAPPLSLPGATFDPKSGGSPDQFPALVRAMRIARQDGFDRIVFEFDGPVTPAWQVAYGEPPFTADGSGEVVQVAGSAFLTVRFAAADAHEEQGGQYVSTIAPRTGGGGTERIREVVLTGDYEAIVSLVIGLDSRRPFLVQQLGGPTRVVVDIAHAG